MLRSIMLRIFSMSLLLSKLMLLLFLILNFFCFFQADARLTSSIPSICHHPPPRSEGLCATEIEGFYFDATTQDCQMYSIGACRMTPGQSFGSKYDCLSTCVRGSRRIQDLYINE